MLLAKIIIPKKIKALGHENAKTCLLLCLSFLLINKVSAQDNSPYSRYGLGDIVPGTNISNRGMAGLTAAVSDSMGTSINFNNPASYSKFLSILEPRTQKPMYGRVILDVGINLDSRTLKETNPPQKFTSTNAWFSYVYVGIPLRKNWGLSFGIRPLTRISYKILRSERLTDPDTGLPIDSAQTEFTGNGGSFLPTIGTGFAIKNLSLGINFGYLFGDKTYSSKRAIINDTVSYYNANFTTQTYFNTIFLQGGLQYKINLNHEKGTTLSLGVSGNLKQTMNASQDLIRETFVRDPINGDLRIDSVYQENDKDGEIIYPASYAVGFVYERPIRRVGDRDYSGFLFGVDYVQSKWSEYRFFGEADGTQDAWVIRAGAQLKPVPKPRSYFSMVDYRFGVFTGEDYINLGQKLPVLGVSFGMGLPIPSNRNTSQYSKVNLAIEYNKRGNDENVLKDNVFRISLGFNFSDIWFVKRKYE